MRRVTSSEAVGIVGLGAVVLVVAVRVSNIVAVDNCFRLFSNF